MERLGKRIDKLAPHWRVHLPEGPGPFPVVVQLSGCGGVKPFQTTWAEVARDAGVAALVVDSFAPRRISRIEAYTQVCTGLRMQGRERAGDLFAALAWVRKQKWADPDKLIAAGWSHGGWTMADALSFRDGAEMARATALMDLPEEPLAGLAGAFFVYPYLGIGVTRGRQWRVNPRCVAVIGGKDSVAGGSAPHRAFALAKAHGAEVDIHVFQDATHAFDEPEARDIRVRHDPALTARAHKLYADFLRSF